MLIDADWFWLMLMLWPLLAVTPGVTHVGAYHRPSDGDFWACSLIVRVEEQVRTISLPAGCIISTDEIRFIRLPPQTLLFVPNERQVGRPRYLGYNANPSIPYFHLFSPIYILQRFSGNNPLERNDFHFFLRKSSSRSDFLSSVTLTLAQYELTIYSGTFKAVLIDVYIYVWTTSDQV